MNFNNRHFQIENSHFHFHKWKHDFTFLTGSFTKRYYICPKCEAVLESRKLIKSLEEILGYSLGRLYHAKTLIDIERLELIKKFHVLVKEEKKEEKKEETQSTCTCTVHPPTDSLLLRYIEMVNYKMCPFCKKELLELLQKE